jgi:cell division transport system permease protein
MISTSFKRILASGAKSFVRGGVVSFATVLIMTVTLIIVGWLVFLSAILTSTLTTIKDKVDVNVYFITSATETDILSVRKKLETVPDVAEVTYTSRETALTNFKERHKDDELTLQALQELGQNPLGASLAVRAKDPSQYEGIVKFLSEDASLSPASGPIIDRINYYQNKVAIDRLTLAIATTERVGLAAVLLFVIASLIIAFTTVRLAIYTSREEIAVMRLVGASNMYIRGPFIVAGVMAGIIAALVALLFFYPATWYAGASLYDWLGVNLFTYYLEHFALVFLLLTGSGVFIGALASFLAVRKYLRV